MPRKRRFAPTGYPFHVINRGNDRRKIFFEDADYEAFIHLLARGKQRYPVKLYALCAMPNHFHAVLEPEAERALSAYLQWVQGRYACDLRSLTRTTGHGHVFQRRFWSDGIDDAQHFLSVVRYVEANPVRAGLVSSADEWSWSSMALRTYEDESLLDPLPFVLPDNWLGIVNEGQPLTEIKAIRRPEGRGRPKRGNAG